MKMTKKALTAMIAASIAATALPAAAMVSNLSNTLTSSNSAGTNNAAPQIGTTTTPQTTTPTATPETGAPAVQAEPSPASMFTTENVDGGVAITGFNIAEGDPTDIVIPSTINDKPVVLLKNTNFDPEQNSSCMTGADQVTSLDTSLCTSLSIGNQVFYKCTNLISVNLSGCNSIGEYAFGCSGITDVTWPTNNMSTIPEYCFADCTSLKTFNNKTDFNLSGITSIGISAFSGCSGITGSIDLSSCNTVGALAFSGCSGITDVTWPANNMSTIPEYCFADCTSLKTFNNDTIFNLSGITSIGTYAFSGCTSITDVTWPTNNMSTIPEYCFAACTSLKTFNNDTIFNLSGITSIGISAFNCCFGITGSVDLSSCTSIGDNAFQDCTSITSVDLSDCTSIGANAFRNCTGITSVDLSNCTDIGQRAFFDCLNLIPTISTKATTVGDSAFSDCPYVTIQADNEDALASYCSHIDVSSTSKGLTSVKKVATLSDTPSGFSVSPSDLANLVPDYNTTYYLTASQNSDYIAPNGYAAANVYDIALKSIKNSESTGTTMTGTVPISITPSEYHSNTSYYLEVNGTLSSAIAPTDNGDGTYTFTQDVALGESSSTVALVYQIMVSSIEISGNNTVPYSENGTVEFSATITPEDALNQNVTWSSSNENALKFSDPNSGTATIVGMGTTTITATATDGSGVTDSMDVSVIPALGAGYTIDYANEKISTIDDGYEVSKNPDFATLLKAEDSVAPGETLYVRAKDTTVYAENKLPERPATPTTPEIKQTAKMVQVTNGKTGQEYKFKKPTDTNHTATFDVWQDSPVLIDDDMTDGATYTVATRVKATDTTFASEEINSTYQPQNIPENGVRLDGGSAGIEWENKTDTSDTKKYGADTPYEIPLYLQTKGGDTYMVEIDWGDMLFSYNFGTWDTETLSYNDDPATLHWGTSFDGTNNQVTVINRSSSEIDTTLNLALNQEQQTSLDSLGFHLTKGNTNDNANNYPTTAQTLQSGSKDNSTTAYINIGADDLTPHTGYDTKTQIGNITVTVQKTANP